MIRIICAAVLLATTASFAEEVRTTYGIPYPIINKDSRWRLFGGLAAGTGSVESGEFRGIPTGQQYLINGVASYQSPRWALDFGLGWLYSQFSGSDSQGLPVKIRTRAGILDISPRFRITQNFQAGPVANFTYGTDTSFAPEVSENLNGNIFAGVRVLYEWPIKGFPLRFLAQVTRDLTIDERNVLLAMGGLQFGLPVALGRKTLTDTVPSASAAPVRVEEVRVILDPKKVFFKTNSTRVKSKVESVLKDIGSYLAAHSDDWESVEIAGHADQRGGYEYNLKLSERRARAVRSAMILGGSLDEKKVKTEAFSFSKPADPANIPLAWKKNRRVELVFKNVRNPGELQQKVRSLSEGEVK